MMRDVVNDRSDISRARSPGPHLSERLVAARELDFGGYCPLQSVGGGPPKDGPVA
jgi:hypothetical protein